MEPFPYIPSASSKRRSSHVGPISLGDTAVPALSTMPLDPKQEKESRRRVRALSASSTSNIPVPSSSESSEEAESPLSSPSVEKTDLTLNGGSTAIQSQTHSALRSSKKSNGTSTPSQLDKQKQKSRKRRTLRAPLTPLQRLWYGYREFSYRNTWCTPLLILLAIAFSYEINPTPSNPMHMFVRLSYEIPKDLITGENTPETVAPFDYRVYPSSFTMYSKGLKDFAFVFTSMIFFLFHREFCMQVILRPLAKFCGLKRRAKIDRFMEQTYSILYFSMSSPLGLYIMYHNPDGMWYYNTESFFASYPHKTHDTLFKLFYLLQAGFWAQQSLVLLLQLEKPRKDFHELVFHHVVTMALIYLSYHFHFAMIGIAVFITMDVSDIFLSLSKTLNYLDASITMVVYAIFVGVWVYTRHYLNIKILWSVLTEFKTVGPYDLNMSIGQYKCWISQAITFSLLLSLQLVNIYWLFLILRIMVRYLLDGEVKDVRSDEEEEEGETKHQQPVNGTLQPSLKDQVKLLQKENAEAIAIAVNGTATTAN